MLKKLSYILFACLFTFGCKNETPKETKKSPVAASSTAPNPPRPVHIAREDCWYKQYSGIVGGKAAHVVMCYYGKNQPPEDEGISFVSTGAYYFLNPDSVINFTIDEAWGDSILLKEQDDTGTINGTWSLVMQGNTVKGARVTKKGIEQVMLQEDYSGGSYPLVVFKKEDSCAVPWDDDKAKFSIKLIMMGPSPQVNKADADFIQHMLISAAGDDSDKNLTIDQFIRKLSASYIKAYAGHIKKEKKSNDYSIEYNNSIEMKTACIYNSDSLLGLEYDTYGYEGGAHGIFQTTTVFIDMKERKQLKLRDILVADSERVSTLLRQSAMQFFNVSSEGQLNEILLEQSIPASENFLLSKKGITFYYNPYEIAGFAYGAVLLEVSYQELGSMLKPEFVRRMNITL